MARLLVQGMGSITVYEKEMITLLHIFVRASSVILPLFINFKVCQWEVSMFYYPISNIDSTYLNEEVRIDFKSVPGDTNFYGLKLRDLLKKNDNIVLRISDNEVKFSEKWRLTPDFIVLRYQSLESDFSGTKDTNTQKIIIKEIYLQKLQKDSLTFRAYLYYYSLKNSETFYEDSYDKKQECVFTVNKSEIKGLLMNKLPANFQSKSNTKSKKENKAENKQNKKPPAPKDL